MFVRLLIGRQIGGIVDMPFHAATASIDTGSAVKATEEEILKAGFQVPGSITAVPEGLPEGYRTEGHESGAGFDLFDPDGVKVNDDHPVANLAAARGMATDHAKAVLAAGDVVKPSLEDMTVAALKEFAVSQQIDLGENTKKPDILAAIQLELEARAAGNQSNQ